MKSYLTGLECSNCRKEFPADVLLNTCECGGSLLARYDLKEIARVVSRDEMSFRTHSLWRWRELLPVDQPENIVSLHEGFTPLMSSSSVGPALGIEKLLFKDESWNPTGSFKARGLSVAVSKAKELGVTEIALPPAGNAGGAAAAYAARGGMKCHVFMPTDTPTLFEQECRAYGADVRKIDGLIGDAGRAMQEERKQKGWFDVSTCKEPYRVEGKKTILLEMVQQMGWNLPEVILFPTGGGTGIIAAWKACQELQQIGWIPRFRMPKLIAVQADGCAPVVRAWEQRQENVEEWRGASTLAFGLRVAKPYAGSLILQAIRKSGGTAVAVSDQAIREASESMATREGMFVAPEAAAGLAALRLLLDNRAVDREQTVVLLLTGCGLKYS